MAYIASSKIQMFPSTKRAVVDKMLSENAMTRNIRQGSEVSFIIPPSDLDITKHRVLTDWADDQAFELYLHGYYFKIESASVITALLTGDTLFAYIIIDKQTADYPELEGQDEDGVYKGIGFVETESDIPVPLSTEEIYSLQIIGTTQAGKKVVPATSFQRVESVYIAGIDGGYIK